MTLTLDPEPTELLRAIACWPKVASSDVTTEIWHCIEAERTAIDGLALYLLGNMKNRANSNAINQRHLLNCYITIR